MIKKRSLKELYTLLLQAYDAAPPYYGICHSITTLHMRGLITYDEEIKLHKDFKNHKPCTIFNRFTWHYTYIGGVYWWKALPEGDAQRRRFILHRIKRSK